MRNADWNFHFCNIVIVTWMLLLFWFQRKIKSIHSVDQPLITLLSMFMLRSLEIFTESDSTVRNSDEKRKYYSVEMFTRWYDKSLMAADYQLMLQRSKMDYSNWQTVNSARSECARVRVCVCVCVSMVLKDFSFSFITQTS